jgi:two-component system OmpR family response regulator
VTRQTVERASERAAMTVLVIDDEADIRHITEVALTRLDGMKVLEADCAETGLTLAARYKPDLILMDFMMPGTDGVDALLALKRDPATAGIPVVFLTAKTGESDARRLKQMGAHGVVTKPFDPITLGARLRSFLQ